ncbi:hypothetical protein C4D60_Mb06t12600 [Musa balbisiana]|uniref:Uncharacterized protein n=1 Tax=Musa balbisiana TaxID=52838 RepID=A0A4S8IMJ3_MUSBA|nr:hypothetical protein C4D60_Mb06t12600 [Musa balbisiana]
MEASLLSDNKSGIMDEEEELESMRGLSKHFNGKSQSFTSLDNVRCLEDLVKPERPCKRRLSSCKSYGGGLDSHKALSPKASSRIITKKASSSSLLSARRHSLSSNRPPVCPPQRPSSLSGQMKFLCA